GEGDSTRTELSESPPHPGPLPASGERERTVLGNTVPDLPAALVSAPREVTHGNRRRRPAEEEARPRARPGPDAALGRRAHRPHRAPARGDRAARGRHRPQEGDALGGRPVLQTMK